MAATAVEEPATADALLFEAGGAGFSDRTIVAAARRSGADALYTFDRRLAALRDVVALEQTPG